MSFGPSIAIGLENCPSPSPRMLSLTCEMGRAMR